MAFQIIPNCYRKKVLLPNISNFVVDAYYVKETLVETIGESENSGKY